MKQLGEIIDPLVWAQESFLIAVNTTYPHLAKTNVITDEYSTLTYETAKKRITLAGFRLANYIKDIYKTAKHQEQAEMTPNKVWNLLSDHSRIVNAQTPRKSLRAEMS